MDYYIYHADSALAWRLFHVTPDMIDVVLAPNGRAISVAEVCADDRRRLLRRHGERQRNDARRLAAGRTGVSRSPVVSAHSHPSRARASVVRRLRDHCELGEHVAQRRLRRVHARASTGARSLARTSSRITTSTNTANSWRSTRAAACRSRHSGSNNIYPKGALVLEMLYDYLGDQRFWAGIHRYLTTHAFGDRRSATICARHFSKPLARTSTGSGPNGFTAPAIPSSR